VTSAVDESIAGWRRAAEAFTAEGEEAPAVRALREQARSSFLELGLPHRKLEAWRHTSLARIQGVAWDPPSPGGGRAGGELDARLKEETAGCVRLVDGRLEAAPGEAAAEGCGIHSIAAARTGGDGHALLGEVLGLLAEPKLDAFTALNTALIDDGALIEIERDADLARPIRLALVGTLAGRLACPRLAVVARPGSRATLIVEHLSQAEGPHLEVLVGEIAVEANAALDVIVLERGSNESHLVSRLHTRQSRDSRLAIHTLTVGGGLVRNDLSAELCDAGAEIDMRGLFIGSSDRHVDNHTLVDHAVPHTTSRELYKGVLGGTAHGVFCGRVVVRPDAQKTDSSQSNPNLLLGERAEIDTQPQLEIHADDVRCSHGSTIGRLDEAALFYLRSRGIGLDEARAMLTRGFAQEIVDALPGDGLRERVEALVAAALDEATASRDGNDR